MVRPGENFRDFLVIGLTIGLLVGFVLPAIVWVGNSGEHRQLEVIGQPLERGATAQEE